MSKKSNTSKKVKIPKEGDNVFLIGEKKHIEMYFRKKVLIKGEEQAFCTWIIPNIKDENLAQCFIGWFPIHMLTLEGPPTPTDIYLL